MRNRFRVRGRYHGGECPYVVEQYDGTKDLDGEVAGYDGNQVAEFWKRKDALLFIKAKKKQLNKPHRKNREVK